MATTQEEIRGWLREGKDKGATHVIVACDEFDGEDYPVFVMPGEDVAQRAAALDGPNMQKVMEVYDLSLDLEMQLREERAYHGYTPKTPEISPLVASFLRT
ncbi:hypothetical protein HY634_03545 [Candidatus Uhrbacteria bacterium]|nr:hypothetical protein [Candidatus Uhrbacteria bacterium]